MQFLMILCTLCNFLTACIISQTKTKKAIVERQQCKCQEIGKIEFQI